MSGKNYGMMVFIILLSSCNPLAQQKVNSKTLEIIVLNMLGEEATIEKNKDQTFALSFITKDSLRSVKYLVIRLSDLKIVEQDTISLATLSWIDTYKIQILSIPGVVRKEDDTIEPKIIDVTKHFTRL